MAPFLKRTLLATAAKNQRATKRCLHEVRTFDFFFFLVATLISPLPPSVAQNGQTPLSIAQRLGYISVVETLKVVTEQEVTTTTTTTVEEKYRVLAPESMQETFMSDSEDEGGEFGRGGGRGGKKGRRVAR